MIQSYAATPVSPESYALGEGPVWDPVRERLLWVDILRGRVYAGRLDPFRVIEEWVFDGTVGAVVAAEYGDLLVAERTGLTRIAPDGRRTAVAGLPVPAGSRLNDGAVDPDGRFVVGSLHLDEPDGAQVLLRLAGGAATVLDDDLNLSNGLGWSPDGATFYSIDSVPGVIHARDHPDGPRRDLFTVTDGLPDGMCVDAAGNLWIANWGGGRVECRTPAGDLLATVAVDAPHTTCVAFAGPGLETLVITTATDQLTAAQLAAHPGSGRVFTVRVDAAGLPTPYWNPAL
jgi:sugar lactone lactonase YvrE